MYFSKHPHDISIDRHWRVFGTLQLMKPTIDGGRSLPKFEFPGNKFSCIGVDTYQKFVNVAKKCYQIKYRLADIFNFHENTCTIQVMPTKSPWLEGTFPQLERLHKIPSIFHGNGRYTKGTLFELQGWGSKCFKTKNL